MTNRYGEWLTWAQQRGSVLGGMLLAALVVGASARAGEVPEIRPVSVLELADAWATNTVNTVIFRHHGLVTVGGRQVAAFYEDPRAIGIVLRDLETGKIERSRIEGNYDIHDAHNAISIGIDSDGYIHLAYDHHVGSLRYRRSAAPWSIREWTDELPMSGGREDRLTYPAFLMPTAGEPLRFLYRDGSSREGEACLKEYSAKEKVWKDIKPCILSGADQRPWTSNPYWNHPAIDSQGRIHLSFVWRTHPIGPNRRVNNIGIDYAISRESARTWESSRGRDLVIPITQVNSETVFAVSPGTNLINQTSMALDSNENPHIVFYSNDPDEIPQYQHLWYDGRQWRHSFLSKRSRAFELAGGGTLQIPIGRPEVLIDEKDRVYVIYRGDLSGDRMTVLRLLPPDYLPNAAQTRVLWGEPLGFAEPIVDRMRWLTEGILSMLIQWNGQPPHDEMSDVRLAPVHIVDWDLVGGWDSGASN